MYELLLYSLKTGACLAGFYLFFKLLLNRETFHRINRILVLGAVVASFVLPLCVITIYREIPAMPEMPEASGQEELYVMEPADPIAEPFPWEAIAGGIFLLGVAVTLVRMCCSLAAVARIIRRNPREQLDGRVILVRSLEEVTPFSWWRYVVVSEADLAAGGGEILLHERAHLRLRHSLDLLITDLAGCLQWFNPAMWLLRRELRDIHEYEADAAVLDSGADARQYQLLLIKKAAGGRWYSVANSFNHSKLKNRITMMLRKKSSRWAVAKALLTLPLAGLALGAFAQTAYVFAEDKGTQKNVTVKFMTVQVDRKEGTTPRITVDGVRVDSLAKPLILVDGEPIESMEEIKADQIATVEVLKDEVAVAQYGEKGESGVIRVTTKKEADPKSVSTFEFTIPDDNGTVRVIGAGKMPETSEQILSRIYNSGGKHKPRWVKEFYDKDMVWVVDGQEVAVRARDVDPDKIASITLSNDAKARSKFPDRGRDGILYITSKKAAEASARQQNVSTMVVARNQDGGTTTTRHNTTLSIRGNDGEEMKGKTIGYTMQMKGDKVDVSAVAQSGLKAAEAGLKSAEQALATAREYMGEKEWREAKQAIAKAREELEHANKQTAMQVADAMKNVPELAGKMVSVNVENSGAASDSQVWHVTTGEGISRVDHSKDEQGKTVMTGRITVHNLSDLPDHYVVIINGKRSTKAEVGKIPAQKIKRMELYSGAEAEKKYGPGVEGAVEITTRK